MASSTRTPAVAAIALVGLGAILLGAWYLATPGPAAQAAPVAAEPHAAPTCPSCPDDAALRRRVAELEGKVQAMAVPPARADVAATKPPELPPPLPFPNTASVANRPEGFRSTVEELLARCAPGLRVLEADCAEYPCIAWSTWDREKMPTLDLLNCEAWTATYGTKLIVSGKDSPDGNTHYVGMFSLPDDPDAMSTAKKRARQRLDALGEAHGVRPK